MNILESKEKLDKRVTFKSNNSLYRELKAVSSELDIPYAEVIRTSIRFSLDAYYRIKDGEDD